MYALVKCNIISNVECRNESGKSNLSTSGLKTSIAFVSWKNADVFGFIKRILLVLLHSSKKWQKVIKLVDNIHFPATVFRSIADKKAFLSYDFFFHFNASSPDPDWCSLSKLRGSADTPQIAGSFTRGK